MKIFFVNCADKGFQRSCVFYTAMPGHFISWCFLANHEISWSMNVIVFITVLVSSYLHFWHSLRKMEGKQIVYERFKKNDLIYYRCICW